MCISFKQSRRYHILIDVLRDNIGIAAEFENSLSVLRKVICTENLLFNT